MLTNEIGGRTYPGKRLNDFLDAEVSRFEFSHFVVLYAPGPQKPREYKNATERWAIAMREQLRENLMEARYERYKKAHQLALKWIHRVGRDGGKDFHYVMAVDDRKMKPDFVFHVALRGDWGAWEIHDHHTPRWKRMSGGVAFVEMIPDFNDEFVRRKFWNLVRHKRCTVELSNGSSIDASQLDEKD
jgi:hypothetical protein